MIFNPTLRHLKETIALPLYFTGEHKKVRISVNEEDFEVAEDEFAEANFVERMIQDWKKTPPLTKSYLTASFLATAMGYAFAAGSGDGEAPPPSATPPPAGEMTREDAERLLDALGEQEKQERRERRGKPSKQREERPEKDW